LKTGEHEQSESGGKGLVLPIASKSRGRHVPSRPQTRSTPGHTGPKGSTVVQGRIGATKVAKDLQTSGTDDVWDCGGWSVHRRTSVRNSCHILDYTVFGLPVTRQGWHSRLHHSHL